MSTFKSGSTKYRSDLTVKCPFCAGEVSFGTEPAPFTAHTMPYCKTFNDLDALEFIQAVNRAAQPTPLGEPRS